MDKPLFCSACGKEAAGHWETEVDPWEFWGAKGVDRHEYFVSDCCNESLFDKDGEPHYEEVE